MSLMVDNATAFVADPRSKAAVEAGIASAVNVSSSAVHATLTVGEHRRLAAAARSLQLGSLESVVVEAVIDVLHEDSRDTSARLEEMPVETMASQIKAKVDDAGIEMRRMSVANIEHKVTIVTVVTATPAPTTKDVVQVNMSLTMNDPQAFVDVDGSKAAVEAGIALAAGVAPSAVNATLTVGEHRRLASSVRNLQPAVSVVAHIDDPDAAAVAARLSATEPEDVADAINTALRRAGSEVSLIVSPISVQVISVELTTTMTTTIPAATTPPFATRVTWAWETTTMTTTPAANTSNFTSVPPRNPAWEVVTTRDSAPFDNQGEDWGAYDGAKAGAAISAFACLAAVFGLAF